MASFTKNGYQPQPGDQVTGRYGKHTLCGKVLPHPKQQGKPWVFQTRWGCVLCYIITDSGSKVAVNELEKI
jgi:hypothetical protein